jgi:hypothetical protein
MHVGPRAALIYESLYVVKSSEDGTIFRLALPLRWIEVEFRLEPALALLPRTLSG